MPFLGTTPQTGYKTIAKQTITGDGSSSYALDNKVVSENELEVFINNVRQEPGVAYTASGASITFTTALESSDDCYIVFQGQANVTNLIESGNIGPDLILTGNSVGIPYGDTASRPTSPVNGSTRFNTDTGSLEYYDGSNWIATNLIPTVNSVTGTIYSGNASTITIDVTNVTDIATIKFSEGGITLSEIPDVGMSSGSASVTVPAAVYAQTAGDTIAVSIINQDGTPSSNAISKTIVALPTGGTITKYDNYIAHTFTSSGTLQVPSGFSTSMDVLIVAGGAGGGNNHGGGGGAGGLIYSSSVSVTSGDKSIVVGAGGAGGINVGARGVSGGISSALGITALGGGGGSGRITTGSTSGAASGGSGGGGAGTNPTTAAGGTSGQGYAGGVGSSDATAGQGGGGGGAGQAGGVGSGTAGSGISGYGGDGLAYDIRTGTPTYYAGGGSGGRWSAGAVGEAGLGGGGTGGAQNNLGQIATPATANTGGGGGGGADGSGVGAAGGSGIVIVRYQII